MKKTSFLLVFLVCVCSTLSAATHYVSDNLYTFLHSGPGNNYKIIGSVNAGDHITIIQRSSDFTQIKDSKGRTGWINSKYVSSELGLKERLPKLESQLIDLEAQLNEAQDKISKDKIKLDENLKTYNSQLSEIKKLQEENANLKKRLDNQRNEQLMTWFTYGGMVAGSGLILGLILPFLIPNRKKKTRW